MPDLVASWPSVDASRSALLAAIGTPRDLTLVRGSRGAAHGLAPAGARRLLDHPPQTDVDLDGIAGTGGDTALLAGGTWGREDGAHLPILLELLEHRFERVVVLPSSFDVEADRVRSSLASTGAVVFAREQASFDALSGSCDVRRAHDTSVFFDLEPWRRRPASGTLEALDGGGDGASPQDGALARAPTLEAWLERLSAHACVRTDRAHVVLAAGLLGRDVEWAASGGPALEALVATLPATARARRLPPARDPARRPQPRPRTGEAPAREAMRAAASAASPPAAPLVPVDGRARVCAVVLSHDRPDLAAAAVRSVTASGPGTRVLVLDTNSHPHARRRLAALLEDEAGVELRMLPRNPGCAEGRRTALERVDEELVLLLDDDAELMPGALERLVAELDEHPGVQAATALVTDPTGRVSHCGGSVEVADGVARFLLGGDGLAFDDPAVPATGPSDWAPGTAAIVRRSAFDACPIDPRMGAYYEDNDWSLRMSARFDRPFRRCREALALHHFAAGGSGSERLTRQDAVCRRIAALARFHEVHGLLLRAGGAELREVLGSEDAAQARILLRFVTAAGPGALLAAWAGGELDELREQARARAEHLAGLEAERDAARARAHAEATAAAEAGARERDAVARANGSLAALRAELQRELDEQHRLAELVGAWADRAHAAERRVAEQADELAWLHERDQALRRLEASRLARLHRAVGAVRRRLPG